MDCSICNTELKPEEITTDNRCKLCGGKVWDTALQIETMIQREKMQKLNEQIAVLHSTNTGIPDQNEGGKL